MASSSAHPLILHSAVVVWWVVTVVIRWLDPNQFPADSKNQNRRNLPCWSVRCAISSLNFVRIVLKLYCEVPYDNVKWTVGPSSAAPVERVSYISKEPFYSEPDQIGKSKITLRCKGSSINYVTQTFHIFGPPSPFVTHLRKLSVMFVTHC